MTKSPQDKRREDQLMHDVLVLLNHLIENEQTTVKLILDCLYDVGSINLINQRVSQRRVNRWLRAIAVLSKPAFRILALRWFRKNCPTLIVNWLQSQVEFSSPKPAKDLPPSSATSTDLQHHSQTQVQELKRLQGKVKVLTSLCLGSMASMTILGGIAAWQVYSLGQGNSQSHRTTPHPTKIQSHDPTLALNGQDHK